MFAVMKHWDLMIGIDRHIPWPPESPIPLPDPVPYVTIMVLMGLQPLTPMMAFSSMTLYGWTMQRGTDIGPGIPHIGMPSLLTPLDMLFSSSVSYFGPTAYQHEAEPCAAALLCVINLNANCQEPVALPTGLVLCITTHYTMMSFFDILFGFGTMIFDMVLDYASCQLSNLAGKVIGKYVVSPIGKKIAAKTASRRAAKAAVAKASGGAATQGAAKASATARPKIGSHRPAPFAGASPSGPRLPGGPQAGGHRAGKSWQAASPSGAGSVGSVQAGGHRAGQSWQAASPSGLGPGGVQAGGHRPAPPMPWTPGKPTKPPAHVWKPGHANTTPRKPGVQIGGHRPGAQKKPKRSKVIRDIVLDVMKDLGMEAPMSVVHMGAMEVVAMSGVEEFGAPPEEQEG